MKKNLLYLSLLATVLGLSSSCTSNSDEPELSGSKVKLQVNGTLGMSRVVESAWNNNDEIGVTVNNATSGSRYNVRYATPDGDGVFMNTDNRGIEFSDGETLTLTAYYPHNTSLSEGIIEFKEPQDFLYASQVTASHSNPKANFSFSHKMAKITFEISDNNKATNNGNLTFEGEVSVSDVVTAGSFNTLTGAVTPSETSGTVTSTFTKSGKVSFIVTPCKARTVKTHITYAGRKYVGTIYFPDLMNGKNYIFNINIPYPLSDTALTITSSSISDWVNTNEGTIKVDPDDGNGNNDDSGNDTTTPSIGDFLLTDGTILSKDSDPTGKNVAGIVFYVGNPQPSVLYPADCPEPKDALKKDAPDAIRGIAVAIRNANPDDKEFGFINDTDLSLIVNDVSNATYYTDNMVTSSTDVLPTKLSGYSYTKYIQYWSDNTSTSSLKSKKFFTALNSFRNTNTVAKASLWYVPSYPELVLIYNNIATINSSLEKIGVTISPMEKNPDYPDSPSFSPCYFSSNLAIAGGSSESNRALFTHTMNPDFSQWFSDGGVEGWLRPVIAF